MRSKLKKNQFLSENSIFSDSSVISVSKFNLLPHNKFDLSKTTIEMYHKKFQKVILYFTVSVLCKGALNNKSIVGTW